MTVVRDSKGRFARLEQRTHPDAPEQRTVDVDVQNLEARGRTVIGYAAVYGRESGDLGGFRERIAPGAFANVLDSDVRCLLNHDPNIVLGRTKSGTLRLADEQRGLRFECDLPESRADLREAVARGDLDGASFRFTVDDEEWDGDLRTVKKVKELRDVTLATYPAYPTASVELRTKPEGGHRPEPQGNGGGLTIRDRGSLRVEDRASGARDATLTEAFRREGFPGEKATIGWDEFRTATFTGSIDALSPVRRDGKELGADVRYAFPAFVQNPVESDVTAVQVLRQASRTLPAAADVVRDIDEVTPKPEVATAMEVVNLPLQQVAAVETDIPNIILEQDGVNSLIEVDLRLAVNEGLDLLVLNALALAGFHDPGTDPLLIAIRKGITVVQDAGYNPDTLIVSPTDNETLDTLRATADAGEQFYVFAPGQNAPDVWDLNRRVSKSAPAPVVADSRAFGQGHVSPITLARFEADSGTTNRSNVRLEGNAVFGAERLDAAVRIAAA